MTKDTNLDPLILSHTTGDFQKIAFVMSKVFDEPSLKGQDGLSKRIVARIESMVERGQLTAQGNIRRWRDASIKK